ncbi:hypothetical protein [Pseudomonas sp.]|uniref:hypothetical protein n=1 Tax=Pseudomonas sp. TaxID=306 RepID=UPI002FC5C1F9
MPITEPNKITTPWASTGSKNPIPANANNTTGTAGFDKGFPDITMTPEEAGGIPPAGQDFNGILNVITECIRYSQSGGMPTFSQSISDIASGYGKGAVLKSDDGSKLFLSKIDSNLNNPNTNPEGWGIIDVDTYSKLIPYINTSNIVVRQIAGVVDYTDTINEILQAGFSVFFEPGVYPVSALVGIKLKASSSIDGAGFMKVIILASQSGGTISDLANYGAGSIIKREFTPGVANDYVTGVRVDNVSVIMRHPTTISGSNYRQIALDLRNCDRSWVGPGFYCGNTTLPGMPFTWEPPRASQAQGYGIVYGTRNSNLVDYCGGVGGIAESPKVYGARKNIVVDDLQLSPQSAAHATIVRSPDLQIGVELISQASKYNAGTVFEDCLLQSSQRFEGSDVTIGMVLAGYNCRGTIRYLEGGPNCDKISDLTSTSSDCEIEVLYASVTGASTGLIADSGSNNRMSYREITPVTGGKTTKGRVVETFNRGYVSRKIVSTYSDILGPQSILGDSGVILERIGAARYKLIVDKPFLGVWGISISALTDASRNGFSFSYRGRTNDFITFDTFVNNSSLDPLEMTISVFQV